jgi:hypothetical protein
MNLFATHKSFIFFFGKLLGNWEFSLIDLGPYGREAAITGNKQVLPSRPREVAVRFRDQTIPEANTLQSRIPRIVLINSSISLI